MPAPFDRIPLVVYLALFLLGGAWVMQGLRIPPEAIAAFLGGKVIWLVVLTAAVAPLAAAFAGVLAVIYMIGHHHAGAIAAGISAGLLVALKLLWMVGLGGWVMGHLV